jgi:hypothetical protein
MSSVGNKMLLPKRDEMNGQFRMLNNESECDIFVQIGIVIY